LEQDPDEALSVPAREVRAALALIDGLLVALGTRPGLADELASVLPPFGSDARLPEVGPVRDTDGLRLYLYRLAERLRPCIAGALVPATVRAVLEQPAHSLPIRRPSRAAALDDDDLAAAFVWWDDIHPADLEAFREVLDSADDERPLQRHLATNPLLLVQHLGGGHGRWVLSQKRLGSEYVTDFVIGERSSGGREWQFVELQSPRARLFVPSTGRHSEQFDEGIRQIQEWRRWLDDNRDYARRPRSRNGLGLEDASGRDPGLLLIGREADLSDADRQRRRQLDQDLNIRIHTYDWLLRQAAARVRELNH
jgi:hypothetical protein